MEGLPKVNQENTIEKSKIKEGVDFVFEQNPELEKIGTKEQYSEYLDSIFPESKVKDILYTGSAKPFKEFKEEKEFGTYFGSWISHYQGKGGRGYEHRKTVILNIKNPRIISPYILGGIDNNNENNEALSLAYVSGDVRKCYNMKDEDGIIDIGHFNGNHYINYKDSEIMFDTDFKKFSDSIFGVDANLYEPGVDEHILLNKAFTEIKKAIISNKVREFGNIIAEAVVFDTKQIHILGSEQDIEGFKKFIENNKDSHT